MDQTVTTRKPESMAAIVKPVLVLVIICTIVGFLLGTVNKVTLPTIDANRKAQAWATYSALIPEASDFSSVPCDASGVTACMKADGDLGFAITAQSKGYSGPVPVAVAIDEGTITNVVGVANTETPGLGTRVALSSFTDQFVGRAAEPMTIDDIDAITGATISSKAALAALNEAIEAYRSASGASSGAERTATEKGAS